MWVEVFWYYVDESTAEYPVYIVYLTEWHLARSVDAGDRDYLP